MMGTDAAAESAARREPGLAKPDLELRLIVARSSELLQVES
jgi:hypothetical protein